MTNKARSVFEYLCDDAFTRRCVTNDYLNLRSCVTNRKPIPDRLLPGRLVMALSPEERSELAKLTSDDVLKYRPNLWASCT